MNSIRKNLLQNASIGDSSGHGFSCHCLIPDMPSLRSSIAIFAFTVFLLTTVQSYALALTDAASPAAAGQTTGTSSGSAKTLLAEQYGRLPLRFEKNTGQTDKRVKFLARGQGYTLFLTPSEAVLKMQKTKAGISATALKQTPSLVLRMQLPGASPEVALKGSEQLPGKSNYFTGNTGKEWRTNIPQYGKVRYHGIYPGIDLVYYGNQQQLEYDFIVKPGADPNAIQIDFKGADRIGVNKNGQLAIHAAGETVHFLKPVIYQRINGKKVFVEGHYKLHDNHVGFNLAAYDANRPLVIDPVLVYSTFLDGSGHGGLNGVAIDAAGNAYVVGQTVSTNFPTTGGAF